MQDRVHNKHVQENTLKSYTQYVYSDVTHKVHRLLVFLRKSEDDGQLLAMPFGWWGQHGGGGGYGRDGEKEMEDRDKKKSRSEQIKVYVKKNVEN